MLTLCYIHCGECFLSKCNDNHMPCVGVLVDWELWLAWMSNIQTKTGFVVLFCSYSSASQHIALMLNTVRLSVTHHLTRMSDRYCTVYHCLWLCPQVRPILHNGLASLNWHLDQDQWASLVAFPINCSTNFKQISKILSNFVNNKYNRPTSSFSQSTHTLTWQTLRTAT